MSKYEFKKFPVLATVVALLTIVAGVFAISFSLITQNFDGNAFLSLLVIIAGVLIFAGLTIGRPGMLRVLSIIITVAFTVTNFVLTIVKYDSRNILLFATALLMLIASVLELIYFLASGKSDRIKTMHFLTSIVLICLVGLYFVIYVIQDIITVVSIDSATLHSAYYPLLIGYTLVSALPVVVISAMSPKEKAVKEVNNQENEPETIDPEQEVVDNK